MRSLKTYKVCLMIEEDKVAKLRRLAHERSLKEEKEISYIDLIREATDKAYFQDKN